MILSVSRRTDIPAFFSEWFFNRLKEGFVYVRNPMNIHQVSKVVLKPEMIGRKRLMYVHEVQHWLRKKDNGEDGLEINEGKE